MIGRVKEALERKRREAEAWFDKRWNDALVPLYCSVDVRNSHHKIAVIDTNAFPAGFNNLCAKYCDELVSAFADYLEKYHPEANKVLIIPELHTRNRFYLENVRRIHAALKLGGFEARVGTIDPDLRDQVAVLEAVEGGITLYRVSKQNGSLKAGDFTPDVLINNNDLSTGTPEILKDLNQPLIPPRRLGWRQRSKFRHFTLLNQLIQEFAEVVELDPWRISTSIARAEDVDFKDQKARDRLGDEVDNCLAEIKSEYEKRGVDHEPGVFIKNDAGTYGMAVMTAASGDDVRDARRKTRVKMSTGKGREPVTDVLIQEAIPTRDSWEGSPMEPVIYLVGDRPVGGFYRLHRGRGEIDNLNVKGMEFIKLCFHQVADKQPESLDDRCEDASDLLLAYGTLARLAALALGMEMKEMEDD